ncbi:MAG: CsiV family protein [Marinobacter sp.]|uniref:CsiV family protein n=1 Tax=unclassified Marinobacter TaxID=83889 RepID=UPI00273C181E|nr:MULTISPECIES: CsiV family protein [unclassified Marinobacter]MDP4546681.1 CsiV family protein [Marinobacter sp. MDS2]
MQATKRFSKPFMTGAVLALAFTLLPTAVVQAQESRKDFYRAEVVILQRLVDPNAVEEQMAGKKIEPSRDVAKSLWVEDASGRRISDLKLAPRNELHLGRAASRLENSGNYRVLAAAGWYQSFPPNYDGSPMRVAIGDWLTGAQQKAVEGHIEIDRQRYLHVGVHLNHWKEGSAPVANAPAAETASTDEASEPEATGSIADMTTDTQQARVEPVAAELVTWIKETRRMRSEEIHFIDSPTIGVLVFFRKL